MDVKVLFDKLNIIDGVKDDFTVKVALDEDVFSVKVVSTSPSEKKMYAKADAIENSASGSIASFPDGANGVPMNSLIANIVPIQSLHGYSSPWPAGGGKNKWNPDTCTAGYFDAAGNPKAQGVTEEYYTDYIPVSANTTYTVGNINYASGESQWLSIAWYDENKNFISRPAVTDVSSKSYTSPATAAYARAGSRTYGHGLDGCFFSEGSNATFSSYSNICPISGRTGLNVYRTGKNLLNPSDVADGYFTSNGAITSPGNPWVYEYIKVNGGATYTISGCTPNAATSHVWVDKYKAFIFAFSKHVNGTFTAPANAEYMGVCTIKMSNPDHDIDTMQVEPGSTATAYEPYNGNTYAVDWTSQAGTVYGGTLDVVTGLLTVDRAIVDLGTLNYTYDSSGRFYTSINGKKNEARDNDMMLAISSMYMPMTATAFQNTPTDGTMRGATTGGYVYFRNSAYTNAATFKTAMSGVQLCYKLATPITYQLTAQEVKTLFGQNCIWSDSGGVSVDYIADTKKYIDNKILQAIAAALNA